MFETSEAKQRLVGAQARGAQPRRQRARPGPRARRGCGSRHRPRRRVPNAAPRARIQRRTHDDLRVDASSGRGRTVDPSTPALGGRRRRPPGPSHRRARAPPRSRSAGRTTPRSRRPSAPPRQSSPRSSKPSNRTLASSPAAPWRARGWRGSARTTPARAGLRCVRAPVIDSTVSARRATCQAATAWRAWVYSSSRGGSSSGPTASPAPAGSRSSSHRRATLARCRRAAQRIASRCGARREPGREERGNVETFASASARPSFGDRRLAVAAVAARR